MPSMTPRERTRMMELCRSGFTPLSIRARAIHMQTLHSSSERPACCFSMPRMSGFGNRRRGWYRSVRRPTFLPARYLHRQRKPYRVVGRFRTPTVTRLATLCTGARARLLNATREEGDAMLPCGTNGAASSRRAVGEPKTSTRSGSWSRVRRPRFWRSDTRFRNAEIGCSC